MAFLFLVAIALLVVPFAVYATMVQSHGVAWMPRPVRNERRDEVGVGPFRAGETRLEYWTWGEGGVPLAVRVAALSSFFLGQMVVPSAPANALGWLTLADRPRVSMVELVLTFTFVPGAYCAVQVFRAGLALLRGVRAPLERVLARATTATVCLNVALLSFGVVAVTARLEDFEWMIASMAYATVSLAQIAFVNWAYRRHAHRYDAPEGSPVSFARPSPAVAA